MAKATTVKVSKETLEVLEALRRELGSRSLEEVIKSLIASHRRALLDRVFGADRGRIKGFTEGDRGEDRG